MGRVLFLFSFAVLCSGFHLVGQTNLSATTQPAPQTQPGSALTNVDVLTTNGDALHERAALQETEKFYNSNWFGATLGAVLGGILGAVAGIVAVRHEHRLQNNQQQKDALEERMNVLRLFRNDLVNQAIVYDGAIGGRLLSTSRGEPFWTKLSLTEGNFLVLSQMAQFIPKLKPDEARMILRAYSAMRFLIEQYRINNQAIDLTEARRLRGDSEGLRLFQEALNLHTQASDTLRALDSVCRNAAEELATHLEGVGIREPRLPDRQARITVPASAA